ncbi:hypothetical protein MRB53_038225 [Persea americana]|nr:hypothetical protein MRB53_038225 [Persea americana]
MRCEYYRTMTSVQAAVIKSKYWMLAKTAWAKNGWESTTRAVGHEQPVCTVMAEAATLTHSQARPVYRQHR